MPFMPAIANRGRCIHKYPIAGAQTFQEGAAVFLDAAGDLTEGAADPAVILGFALHGVNQDPEPGFALVAVAKPDSTFILRIGAGAAAVQADEGDTAAIVSVSGVWTIDKSDATVANHRVRCIKALESINAWECSIISDNAQLQIIV